jgi:hypothetical protein
MRRHFVACMFFVFGIIALQRAPVGAAPHFIEHPNNSTPAHG